MADCGTAFGHFVSKGARSGSVELEYIVNKNYPSAVEAIDAEDLGGPTESCGFFIFCDDRLCS